MWFLKELSSGTRFRSPFESCAHTADANGLNAFQMPTSVNNKPYLMAATIYLNPSLISGERRLHSVGDATRCRERKKNEQGGIPFREHAQHTFLSRWGYHVTIVAIR